MAAQFHQANHTHLWVATFTMLILRFTERNSVLLCVLSSPDQPIHAEQVQPVPLWMGGLLIPVLLRDIHTAPGSHPLLTFYGAE